MLLRSAAICLALVAGALWSAAADAAAPDVKKAGGKTELPRSNADAGHGKADEHHGHEQRLRGDKQPEDPIGFDLILFVFTLVLFLLLLYLLNQYAWQPILQHFAERDRRVDEAVRQAQIAREEMQRLSMEADKSLAAAHEEVRKTLDQVRAEASKDAESMLTRAKEEAAKERADTIASIEQAKEEAKASLQDASVKLAAQMAGKIAERPIDASSIRKHLTEN